MKSVGTLVIATPRALRHWLHERSRRHAIATGDRPWTSAADVLATLAAACGFGLAGAHPYADGNKRAALLARAIFPGLNGKDLDVSETEVVIVCVALAAGQLTERSLADWLRPKLLRLTD